MNQRTPVSLGVWPWLIATVLLLASGLVVTGSMVLALPGVSPIDEWAYIDSLDKADRFTVPRPGATIDQYARDVVSCRGVYGVGPVGNPCGFEQPDGAFPLGAVSPAPIHPPTYFLATALMTKPLRWIGVTHDLAFAGRIAGTLWLTAGGLVLMKVVALWHRPWYVAPILTVALATTPTVATVLGFITPDAAFLVSSAIPLLGVSLWLKRDWPAWTLLLFGAGPALFKATHILATIGVSLAVLIAAVIHSRGGTVTAKTYVLGGTLLVTGAGIGLFMWTVILDVLAVGSIPPHPEVGPPMSLDALLSLVGYPALNFPRISGAPIPLPDTSAMTGALMSGMAIAATVGTIAFVRNRFVVSLAAASLMMLVLGSVILTTMIYIASGGFLVATPRYALGFAALPFLPFAASARPRTVSAVLGFVALLGLAGFVAW